MHDLEALIVAGGYIGIFLTIFAESGLFFAFFLPGESLLFSAGFLASSGHLNIWVLVVLVFVAGTLGGFTGYSFGRKVGPKIFSKPESFFFHPSHIESTEKYFREHGKSAIILARFVPIIRTFTPIMSGVGKMQFSIFSAYNIIGAALWATAFLFGGFFLKRYVPGADHMILPLVLIIICISVIPNIRRAWRNPHTKERLLSLASRLGLRRKQDTTPQ